jgi:gamma-glutamyl-gamma-aminobutyrate hydrolase PuuD
MKKKVVGILPTIKETYKNQFNYVIDLKLYAFIDKIYNNPIKRIISNILDANVDVIFFSGGNTLIKYSKKKEDKIRDRINGKILNYVIKNNIKCVGICGGAQFIADHYNSTINNSKNHIGNHFIYCEKDGLFFKNTEKFLVNSYHNQVIKKTSPMIENLLIAEDRSIEMFKHKKKPIYGIMWHPERYKKIKKLDQIIFNKIK